MVFASVKEFGSKPFQEDNHLAMFSRLLERRCGWNGRWTIRPEDRGEVSPFFGKKKGESSLPAGVEPACIGEKVWSMVVDLIPDQSMQIPLGSQGIPDRGNPEFSPLGEGRCTGGWGSIIQPLAGQFHLGERTWIVAAMVGSC